MKNIAKAILIATTLLYSFAAQAQTYLNPKAPLEERVEDALKRMTVEEKIDLFHAAGKFTSLGVPRLGIRQLNHSDGPHGCRAEVDWNTWNSANWTNDSCVAFPSLSCLAATWNQDMSRLYGKNVSEEFAFRGKDLLLGPGVNIVRTPLNGRNFEYMGEDPFLAGEMAYPYIIEAQKNGVACCLKHFFLNNQEKHRFSVNVNISERAVREIYLPAFKKCVDKGGVWSIMGSYNRWNNTHCCHNDSLLNGILKREWGFDGAVVSDWGGTHDTDEAVFGGLDIEMGTNTNGKTTGIVGQFNTYYMADPLKAKVKQDICLATPCNSLNSPTLSDVIDEKARRVLRTIFRASMNPDRVIGNMCSEEHYDASQKIAEEGIVLLKNDKLKIKKDKSKGKNSKLTPILPLNAGLYNRILVVGENATRNLHDGGGSSELKTKHDILPLDELKAIFGDKIDYAKGYDSGRPLYGRQEEIPAELSQRLFDEAIEKAKSADLIIYIGGLNKNKFQDCEDGDRKTYALSFGQNELISALAKVQPNIIVITNGGCAYETPWLSEVKALLHCWYPGSMGGRAIGNILTGKVNPSGKMPMTWAKKYEDYYFTQFGEEAYPGIETKTDNGIDRQVYYKDDIYVGYRHFNTHGVEPQFPFGYGLSYTTFKYGKAQLFQDLKDPNDLNDFKPLKLSIDITNTGTIAGKEIVQLYISDPECSVSRPAKELKGFQKISLNPGETKTVTFDITEDMLQFWSEKDHKFITEPGLFRAHICASETDIKSTVEFTY